MGEPAVANVINKGLEGVIALSSSICSIIDGVLRYRGYTIDDLVENTTFEEVIYLLWNEDLPNKKELKTLKEELSENFKMPTKTIEMLKNAPVKERHPMSVLRTAVSYLAFYDKDSDDISNEANYRKSRRLVPQICTIAAAIGRLREGKDPIEPDPKLDISQNFLYMLTGKKPAQNAHKFFDQCLTLHADHELNASTWAARVTVATLSDMHSGIVSAIGTLRGPLHGGANQHVMLMLQEIKNESNIEKWLDDALAKKKRVMGIGHRVYKDGDPRARYLKKMSETLSKESKEPKWYNISVKLADLVYQKKQLKPNVDFYSASTYYYMGINPDMYTPIFAIGRTPGWIAHILEQYSNNRLIRPRAEYIGVTQRKVKPIDRR